MDFNQVVAANLRRIREDKDLSVAEVAERTGSKKSLVYDWERPRKGAAQRAFLWSEIVLICAALDLTIFELVLPPDDGSATVAEYMDSVAPLHDWLESEPLKKRIRPADRNWLMDVLFGVDFKPEDIGTLSEMKSNRTKQFLDELTALLKEAQE